MSVSYCIVIPAFDAAGTIAACVRAAFDAAPPPNRVIVFDDGSRDDTAAVAERLGAEVMRHAGPQVGPACGRNAAAMRATEDIIVFVDADVVIEPDAPRRLIDEILSDDRVAAAFGSYTARQAAPNVAARYTNLRHHYFHQTGAREAVTFWTGLGAVRRSVFAELGGFRAQASQRSLEDVEFGFRLRERGFRIRLAPEAQGVHLKNWTLPLLWRTDIALRAVPWAKLIVEGRAQSALNDSAAERAVAVLAHLIWMTAAASFLYPPIAVATALAILAYVGANWPLLRLLRKHAGWPTAVAGLGLHWAYHLYASVTFAVVLARARVGALCGRWTARSRARDVG